ncbi:heavy-metal-associated domain-containing protein [Candidatus Shapirobacteria bacterium]|nr:heavy-metal-associated domain-containing protein [Candidatus Shapirobacteria bacterium]
MTTQTITFKVDDMHCPSCPRLIQLDLQDRQGVVVANASLDTKLVVVEYDPDTVSPVELISTIKESGYTATTI